MNIIIIIIIVIIVIFKIIIILLEKTCYLVSLSESCSHIGAVLFAVEAGVRMRNSITCTQERSTWLLPSYAKEV